MSAAVNDTEVSPFAAPRTKLTDYQEIAAYGILRTPGLVVDEQVLLSGRVPTSAQVRDLLAPLTH